MLLGNADQSGIEIVAWKGTALAVPKTSNGRAGFSPGPRLKPSRMASYFAGLKPGASTARGAFPGRGVFTPGEGLA